MEEIGREKKLTKKRRMLAENNTSDSKSLEGPNSIDFNFFSFEKTNVLGR